MTRKRRRAARRRPNFLGLIRVYGISSPRIIGIRGIHKARIGVRRGTCAEPMSNSPIVPSQLMPAGSGLLARLSPRARALMVLATAGVVAIVSAAWLWSSSPSYSVLFTNLSDRDGGAVIAQLSQMNVPYRNADGGTILVPADKV